MGASEELSPRPPWPLPSPALQRCTRILIPEALCHRLTCAMFEFAESLLHCCKALGSTLWTSPLGLPENSQDIICQDPCEQSHWGSGSRITRETSGLSSTWKKPFNVTTQKNLSSSNQVVLKSVVPGPSASASPWNLSEMHTLGPQP